MYIYVKISERNIKNPASNCYWFFVVEKNQLKQKKKKQTHLQTFSIRWKKWALKLKKNHQSEKSDNVLEEGFV